MLTLASIVYAIDVRDFTFSHIGMQEGIANQRVYSVAKTTDGAIWWTTKLGVDRTNGAKVERFQLGDMATYYSFAGRTVRFASFSERTMQDSLFVFDNKGRLYRYNKTQNRFVLRYDISQHLGSDIVVEDVFITRSSIFFAMREGLCRVSAGSPKPVFVRQGSYYNAIIPLKDTKGNMFKGNVLLATDKGLMLTTVTPDGAMGKIRFVVNEYVCSAYYDPQTTMLWLGTLDHGIKVARWGSNQWTDVAGVPHNPIRSIVPYDRQTMLFGIDGFGVYQSARQQSRTSSLLFDANNGRNGVLHGNGVYAILVGEWSSIVIGTYSGGIDIAHPVGSTTAIFQHIAGSMQCISNDHVNCVAQTDATHLLMGTDNGLSIFDSSGSTWNNVAQGMVVLDVCKKPDGGILLATYGNGVCEVGAGGSVHTIYSKANGTLYDDHVYNLLYDKHGNLWIGCLFGKLTEITPSGTKHYDIDNVLSIKELPDGRIAVGSAHGLFIANPATGQVKELKYSLSGADASAKGKDPEVNKYVQNLFVDRNDILWIATDGGGVYRLNIKSGRCTQITKRDGLPSNSVSSITKDRTGRIWFGTENGLAFIYPNNPSKVIDVNYSGGVLTEYSRGAACNLLNGHMLLGTIEGAGIIDPQHLQKLSYSAPLRLLRIATDETDSADVAEFNEQVEKMLGKGIVHLSYSQRSFELYFECINMLSHFDIAYQYKMGDGEWSEPNDNQYIRFVNLEPGRHILYIRCVSKTGGAVLDTRKVEIIISEPWWNSWWMWCIYIAFLVLAFYGAWRVYDLQARYKRLIMERVASEQEHSSHPATEDHNATAPTPDETATGTDQTPQDTAPDVSEEFVNKATNLVLDNLSDTDFTIDTLCREIGMSRTLFYLKVKSFTGKSPQDFVRMIRLEKASSLLRNGRSVTEVATLTGFDNPKYFSVVFKKYFGISPSKY